MVLSRAQLDFLHEIITPLLLALSLSILKLAVAGKRPTTEEANGIAMDIVAASVGALGVFYYKGREPGAIFLAAVCNGAALALLLLIRGKRAMIYDSEIGDCVVAKPIGIGQAGVEIVIGILAAYLTIKAP